MKIKIKVTKEILHKSKMCSSDTGFVSENCAVALAVREIFPGAQITGFQMDTWIGCPTVMIDLPLEASLFIHKFDNSTPEQRALMNPISFDIEVPDSVIEKIGISQVYKILSESKTLEYVG